MKTLKRWCAVVWLSVMCGVVAAAQQQPPIDPKHLASALTALDIGLAVQNLVDPDEVPLDLYPQLYGLLFGPLIPDDA